MLTISALNKIRILKIKNKWQIAIVETLVSRRGYSSRVNRVYAEALRKLKSSKTPNCRRSFTNAFKKLQTAGLAEEIIPESGKPRIVLSKVIWNAEDSLVESIAHCTIDLSLGRRNSLKFETMLKEVRATLRHYDISEKRELTRVLVAYFLVQRCGWKRKDGEVIPPVKASQAPAKPLEEQPDLFGGM